MMDDEAYPLKLVELWFPGRVDVVNITGLLTSQRFNFWCDALLVKGHVTLQDDRVVAMVTMVTAMPDHRRYGNYAEVELT